MIKIGFQVIKMILYVMPIVDVDPLHCIFRYAPFSLCRVLFVILTVSLSQGFLQELNKKMGYTQEKWVSYTRQAS